MEASLQESAGGSQGSKVTPGIQWVRDEGKSPSENESKDTLQTYAPVLTPQETQHWMSKFQPWQPRPPDSKCN